MSIEITKELIGDAIIGGCGIPLGGLGEKLTPFCGNQWNEYWKWNREELEKISMENLITLYKGLK